MGIVYKNNAKTTLSSSVSNSATSLSVVDGSVFPDPGAGEFFLVTLDDGSNNEIVKCTARSSNTLTVVRAQESTTARAFSSGDAAEGRVTAGFVTSIQENIAAKSANQTVYNATAASSATDYDIGVDPGVEANAMVFLDGVMQHHDTFSFSGSTLTFDAAPTNGTKIEVIVDNLINLQSSNLTVDTFTATSNQTAFTLSDSPGGETNVLAFIDGVFQNQSSYSLSSNILTFDTGVVVGRTVTVYTINPVNIGTPSDGTVTSAKLTGNITLPGSLTVGSNNVAFDSPTFVVDHANSRVGLGTATPSVPVDIVGEAKVSSHLSLPDNAKLKVGTGGDLEVYHNGTHSYIDNNKGALFIRNNVDDDDNNNIIIQAKSGEHSIICNDDGAVVLYYDDSPVAETAAGGLSTSTGMNLIVGASASLSMNGTVVIDSSRNLTNIGTLNGITTTQSVSGNRWGVLPEVASNGVLKIGRYLDFHATDGDTSDYGARFDYDGSKMILTSPLDVTGNLNVAGTGDFSTQVNVGNNNSHFSENNIRFKSSGDAYIDHNTVGQGFIFRTGISSSMDTTVLAITSGGQLKGANGTAALPTFAFVNDPNTGVYRPASDNLGFVAGGLQKAFLSTTQLSVSANVNPGADNTYDLGTSSSRWRNLYTTDLHLSNEGSKNDVDGTSGNWTIQEGDENLYIINNKSGKKYKFALEEID